MRLTGSLIVVLMIQTVPGPTRFPHCATNPDLAARLATRPYRSPRHLSTLSTPSKRRPTCSGMAASRSLPRPLASLDHSRPHFPYPTGTRLRTIGASRVPTCAEKNGGKSENAVGPKAVSGRHRPDARPCRPLRLPDHARPACLSSLAVGIRVTQARPVRPVRPCRTGRALVVG
jgi:hypothetical protein